MTAILADVDKIGNIWMAGERRVTAGDRIYSNVTPKIIKSNNLMMSFAGSVIIMDKIKQEFTIPCRCQNINIDEFAMKKLFPSIVQFLYSKGFMSEDGNKIINEELDTSILVGIEARLFDISLTACANSILEVYGPYSLGSGGEYAIAAYKATQVFSDDIKFNLKAALEITAELCSGCDDDIDIITDKYEEE